MQQAIKEILNRKQAAEDYLVTKRMGWDKFEQLFHNQLNDAISQESKSQNFDPKLSTLTLERSYRVMAQLATGKVKAISKNDLGTTQLMSLIIDKYVNPNANAQFDLLTKFRMVDLYSNIYGQFFALVDWDVKPNGYIGPDMWLLNIRDIFPQVGAVSLDDSDYVIVRSWKSLAYFENLLASKQKGFKNLPAIIAALKGKTGDKQAKDVQSRSQREQAEYPTGSEAKEKGYFEVLSQYEGDRWIDYVVDAKEDGIFRDGKNPHDNDELPVIGKSAIPLLDDFMGMGDFERGAPMQNVINSAWNLYLQAVKMSIFPPIAINKDAIAVPSSIQAVPASKWMMRTGANAVQGAVSPINLNPQGILTFNNVYGVANGSLQNLFGTTDTTVTAQAGGGADFGKTPQAIQMQAQRENTRDNADRFMMEQFVSKVYKKFVNLVAKKQSSAITIRMFKSEIEQLALSYPDIQEMYDENTGKLTIDKKKTASTLYDWEIESGSTYALDQKSQQQNLIQLLNMLVIQTRQGAVMNPVIAQLQKEGMELKLGQLLKKIIVNLGIQDWDKILVEQTPQERITALHEQQAQQVQAAMQQIQAQGMNQTPAQPGAQPQGAQGTPMPQGPVSPPIQPQQGPPMIGGPNG